MRAAILSRLTLAERAVGAAEEFVSIGLVLAMAAVVNLQIIARYIFASPFIWPEEITRLTLVWLTFIASAAVARGGADIAVDTFVEMMPRSIRRVFILAKDLLLAALFAFVAVQGWRLVRAVQDMPLVATELPTSLLAWPLVLGALLIAFHSLLRFGRTLSAPVDGPAR